jgi:dTDP-4-amino-4,6-dideoxygalactose transaminase
LLEEDNARRRTLAARYRERLGGMAGLRLLHDAPDDEPVYHQFTVLTARREALRSFLGERGIGTAVHYPLPLHRQPAFASAGGESFPVAERAAGEVLCLPMFPELEDGEVDRICEAVAEFFAAP